MTRQEQLIGIRPRLLEVISETYQPANWRFDLFFGGAKSRDELKNHVRYGDIREEEVSVIIIPEIQRWALRAERWTGYDDEEVSARRE